MKYYIQTLIIFFVLVSLLTLPTVLAKVKLKDKVVVIDVGHGGTDPGAIYQDIYEKDINLAIGIYLKKQLIKNGIRVIMTRDADYDLSAPNAIRRKKSDFDNRIKIINNSNANMYVSIHLNYLQEEQYYGAQVFYTTTKKENKTLAYAIQEILKEELNSPMGIKQVSQEIYMYDKLNIKGVLIECGFLSNTQEREKLQTAGYQLKVAKAIAKGIIKNL